MADVVSKDQGNPTLRPEAHDQVADPMRKVGFVSDVILHEIVAQALGADLLHCDQHRLARGLRWVPGGPVRVPSERQTEGS